MGRRKRGDRGPFSHCDHKKKKRLPSFLCGSEQSRFGSFARFIRQRPEEKEEDNRKKDRKEEEEREEKGREGGREALSKKRKVGQLQESLPLLSSPHSFFFVLES